ncbi:hypothetical protein AgCh_018732 [Apium graveolens]
MNMSSCCSTTYLTTPLPRFVTSSLSNKITISVAEVENDDVFHDFIKDRENGDFVTKIIDSLWLRDVKHIVNVKTQLRSHSSQLYQESVDDESEGGFLKLKTTSEWLLGDNTTPVNKKVMYEESSSLVIQETLQFPIQKVSCGIGGIGIGHTVNNEFCSSCSYKSSDQTATNELKFALLIIFAGYSVSLPWLTRLKIALGAAKGLAIHATEQGFVKGLAIHATEQGFAVGMHAALHINLNRNTKKVEVLLSELRWNSINGGAILYLGEPPFIPAYPFVATLHPM